ncbi:MAG: alpha/beta fold hydrolase [Xanthobacteraceae bacterium]
MAAGAQTNAMTFVLVHGAWHGGWCWRRVADLLSEGGHKVFTPTLTGLGERSHLMSGSIALATHVTDIVNVIQWEDLNEVVLVGHSYAGFVISGVAEQVPLAIASLVFLDAFVPETGQCLLELTAPATREVIEAARLRGDIAVPARSAEFFKVNEKDRAWVDALCTPQPIATLLDRITLTGAREHVGKKTYIRARDYPNPAFDAAYERLQSNPAWRVYEVPCGHDVMVDMPERLTEILLEAAQ